MGLTLSHISALDATRMLRANGADLRKMDAIPLSQPTPWIGKRWSPKAFDPSVWPWPSPSRTNPLHVLVPSHTGRIRMDNVTCHCTLQRLPPHSIIWLDDKTSMVSPELLFVQMGEVLSFPKLVMLGYELCGYFTRQADDPLRGDVITHVPMATSFDRLLDYINTSRYAKGSMKARRALEYVSEQALSALEALLGTVFSLPPEEEGYGFGPVALNTRVRVAGSVEEGNERHRYPDIMFSFAPVGFNYDGEEHLDLTGLVQAARDYERSDGETKREAAQSLVTKQNEVRAKAIDDIRRNRELLASGRVVLPVTKEDLRDADSLDGLASQLLDCAHGFFGVDVAPYRAIIEDTSLQRGRRDLFATLLPHGHAWGDSHGTM